MGAHEKDVSVHALDDQAAAKDVEITEGSMTPTTTAKPFGTLSSIGMGYAISNTGITCIGSLAVSLAGGGRVVFVWGLLLVFLMACCVACSLGELFSAMPHAGGQYYWTSKMAPLRIRRELSYLVGSLSWSGAVVTAASATLAIPQYVLGMVKLARDDFEIETWMVFVGYQITNIVMFCFNLVERFLPAINVFNLGFSIVTVVAIFVALLAIAQQKASAVDIFGFLENETGWPDGVAFIAALAVLNYGFACLDAVAHMADEVPNADGNSGSGNVYRLAIHDWRSVLHYGFRHSCWNSHSSFFALTMSGRVHKSIKAVFAYLTSTRLTVSPLQQPMSTCSSHECQ